MGPKTHCANGNTRTLYLRIRLLRIYKDLGLGRNGEEIGTRKTPGLNPTTAYCISFPERLRLPAHSTVPPSTAIWKVVFRERRLKGLRLEVDRPHSHGRLLLAARPTKSAFCFFPGDSQLVTVPRRSGLTSGTEFILFYFSISPNRSCWAPLEWSHKNIPGSLEIHVNIIIARDKIVWHFWNNINGDLQTRNRTE